MQPVDFPQQCPECKSDRFGVQEKKAFFRCGSIATATKNGLTWYHPEECVLGSRKNGTGSDAQANPAQQS